MFDPSLAASELVDPALRGFVQLYLCRRYEGLVTPATMDFESTADFVERMLKRLVARGPDSVRETFLRGAMRDSFRRICQRVGTRNFDYDAAVFFPLVAALPANTCVLDFGAGNNNFLPAMAARAARGDITYYATDYFIGARELPSKRGVEFVHQPGPDELPDVGPFDLILLRRVAHHVPDFGLRIGHALREALKPRGVLVLIEDSYNASERSVCPEVHAIVDAELTEAFYSDLNAEQRLRFLRFNDFYSNHVYHAWTKMPLPMTHKTFHEWERELARNQLVLQASHNMGFPKNTYNIHQAATGILTFRAIPQGCECSRDCECTPN